MRGEIDKVVRGVEVSEGSVIALSYKFWEISPRFENLRNSLGLRSHWQQQIFFVTRVLIKQWELSYA